MSCRKRNKIVRTVKTVKIEWEMNKDLRKRKETSHDDDTLLIQDMISG